MNIREKINMAIEDFTIEELEQLLDLLMKLLDIHHEHEAKDTSSE